MKTIKLEIKQKEIFSNILSVFIITNVFIQLISTSRQLFMKRSIISAPSIQLCKRYYPLCQEKGYIPSPDREASKHSAVGKNQVSPYSLCPFSRHNIRTAELSPPIQVIHNVGD